MTALPFPYYDLYFNHGSRDIPFWDMVGYLHRQPNLLLHHFSLPSQSDQRLDIPYRAEIIQRLARHKRIEMGIFHSV